MKISTPTPELPVRDVIAAQGFYRDRLGFEVAWYNLEARMGAVSHGDCAIFLRQTDGDVAPGVFWFFVADVDGAEAELRRLGSPVTDPVADRPWGLRQFTVTDPDGHSLHFFCDLPGFEAGR